MNTIPLSTYVNAICQSKIPGVHDVADTVYGKKFEGENFCGFRGILALP